MEKNRSKIKEVLKKFSNRSTMTLRQTPTDTPNPYSLLSPKKSMPSSPLKQSVKINTFVNKGPHQSKKYALNKTSYGPTLFNSEIPSYISTPNNVSLSTAKLKKFGSNRKPVLKTKEIFNSTEDENISGDVVKI